MDKLGSHEAGDVMQRGESNSLLGIWVVGIWATPLVPHDLASDQPKPYVLIVLDGHDLGVLCASLQCPGPFHCQKVFEHVRKHLRYATHNGNIRWGHLSQGCSWGPFSSQVLDKRCRCG